MAESMSMLAVLRRSSVVRSRLNVGEEELVALLFLAECGGAPQRRLAELAGLSPSGAGALVARLEEDGLVERRGRERLVELSEAGRARLLGADDAALISRGGGGASRGG
jgi:DNA-binding MarR family transcriptional regulator